ncbi:MAG: 1-deoxy-D-xylulose-5-phosphate synthase [Oscillospiraceae bacterium]|nr:1-deoxy-D-xylulose-5-phosphate synthase [Oscillospiraceae bacterium]
MVILDKIHGPEDIKALSPEALDTLCQEIRDFLLQSLSEQGGHLASNLGAVELTVALHRVYDTAKDRLVFDVGHQCYTHKLLTGRMAGFDNFRDLGGMSGFPKPKESVHDAFIAGHASNSVSVALGMARARTAMGGDYDVVALIGDGALNGGMSIEGLSDAGQSGEPLVVILNDNEMSINQGVGGLAAMLSRMRTRPQYLRFKRWYRKKMKARVPGLYKVLHRLKTWLKERIIPDNIFDDFGFEYIGPIDGHSIEQTENALRWAKAQGKPCLVHVITQKGRGYPPAEQAPEAFHGVGVFDLKSGVIHYTGEDFSSVFGRTLTELAGQDDRIVAITAAMKEGTGLIGFQEAYPDRFFDVGIAEEHACAMAAGMAAQGLIPVFAVYSTFLQRSYDMLIHDVSLMGLHVVFGVDRAGIVGRDGETHQGAFDVAYLSSVPGMRIYAPASFAELRAMLRRALLEDDGPVAVRYPRGGEGRFRGDTSDRPSAVLRPGTDVTIAAYGWEINPALEAADMLEAQGISAEVVKINLICPVDPAPVLESVRKTAALLVPEDVCRTGCVGGRLLAAAGEAGIYLRHARLVNLESGILEHGDPAALREKTGLDSQGIARAVREMLDGKDKT